MIQELRAGTTLPIKPVKVDADKVTRAHACSPFVECGKVYIPESATSVADYLDELAAFPSGTWDDQVDSTPQGLNHLLSPPESGIFAFVRKEVRTMGWEYDQQSGGLRPLATG